MEYEGHYGFLNFVYKADVFAPVTTYQNKWSENWWTKWFYYTMEGEVTGSMSSPPELPG